MTLGSMKRWKRKKKRKNKKGVAALVAGELSEARGRDELDLSKWDDTDHLTQGNDLTVQYLFVVDAVNFCFWPDGTLEYEHISGNLKVGRQHAILISTPPKRLARLPTPFAHSKSTSRLTVDANHLLTRLLARLLSRGWGEIKK